jgi:ferritin-like metal-binding protein YciE
MWILARTDDAMNVHIARNLLIDGLRNARAMETQARELMERQSERTSDFPQIQAKLCQHLTETREQLKRLEECLHACGESASPLQDAATSIKDATISAMANVTAMAHALAGDEILKDTFANNAFEHYEIAAYKSLLALSEQAGIDLSVPLQTSLCEEQEMADWIDQHVKDVTLQYLEKQAVAQAATRKKPAALE